MDSSTRAVLFHVLAWLDSMKSQDGVDVENLDVGLQCLSQVFGLNPHDMTQKNEFALSKDVPVMDIFNAGLKALDIKTQNPPMQLDADSDPVVLKNPDLWHKWLGKLEAKGFFKDTVKGTDEYANRVSKALAKFKEKFGDVPPPAPAMSKEEAEAKADECKAKGNNALNTGDYSQACEYYQQAIQLSPNGLNSHIYHSNLAAALMHQKKYHDVISHCEQAIELKPSYVKSYSRMGSAQVQLKHYDDAIDTFRRGLEIDPTNAACKEGLADAENRKNAFSSSSAGQASRASAGTGAGAGAGGMPDLSSLAGMFGGGGGNGLADLMNNPQMAQMASSFMQNPQMRQMAQNMMQNPEMLNNLMGSLGGGAGRAPPAQQAPSPGGNSGMPDLSGMMNSPEMIAARSDPELQEFFQDIEREGPSAAMRHMSNPKVSQLVQSAMSRFSS